MTIGEEVDLLIKQYKEILNEPFQTEEEVESCRKILSILKEFEAKVRALIIEFGI